MALNCGIVGLPNVGKSTIFNALTAAEAQAANYPFCTIDPNVGIVSVPDERLDRITEFVKPNRTVPTTMDLMGGSLPKSLVTRSWKQTITMGLAMV